MLPARPRILYLVPGHHFLPTAGPSRNALSVARALARRAEVTLAFRTLAAPVVDEPFTLLALDPGARLPAGPRDDAATRDLPPAELLRYLLQLRRFARSTLARFDLVLEKSWLFSGSFARSALARGRLGAAVENFVPALDRHARGWSKRLRLWAAERVVRNNLHRLPLVIAETEALRRAMVARWGLRAERIVVVPLGIDRTLFHPRPQEPARRTLGLSPEPTILLYVGVLDATHDLWPLLEAMAACSGRLPAALELHVVGDGERRTAYEFFVHRHGLPVRFHGRVPHEEVPLWIAAADLCLAPYDPRVFAGGELGYATMKIPEYLAVGRPVAAVASARARQLLRPGETGFLLDNRSRDWQALLADFPGRERLRVMAEAAAATPLPSWEDTAEGYLEACARLGRERGKA